MILRDVIIYGSPEKKNIHISNGKIKKITCASEEVKPGKDEAVYHLDGATVFPGFINSHDHLDFNNYPKLSRGPYKNYTEWGPDIHTTFEKEIAAVKKIPLPVRIQWGIYKNLLNGFTTVVNHGNTLQVDDRLLCAWQEHYSLHSVAFEKYWWWKLNNPFRNKRPYVMHLGEGVDERASQEIRKVARSNLFGKKIVAVHGVVMSCTHAASFKALVWCPASNFLLFGETAAVDQLKNSIHIVFGTDSTLTSPWRVKEHFQMALQGGLVIEEELVAMLTLTAAQTWKFHNKGQIAENKNADIVAYSSGSLDSARLQLVIKNGEVMVAEETILNSNSKPLAERYSRIRLDGQVLIVKGNLDEIVHSITRFYPEADIPFELL